MNNIERLQEKLYSSLPCTAAAVVSSEANTRYLTSFPSSNAAVVITLEKAYYLTDFRYAEAARKNVKGCEVISCRSINDTLKEMLPELNIKELLFEYDSVTYAEFVKYNDLCKELSIELVKDRQLSKSINCLRAIKQPYEIEKIKAAQAITDASFDYILDKIKPGVTEREIALEIEFFMKSNGAEALAFDLIVVSGENGSLCHGVPGNKQIQNGELITLDIGAVVDGYHSDMTRTVALGKISDMQRDIYETVLKAQTSAIKAAQPDVECCKVDYVARSIIDEKYPGTFGHATGHSVGIEIHEGPNFAPSCKEILKPGMVITVEPGIYVEGKCGVRIEDMILITEEGNENITHSPKDLIIL